MEDQGGNSHLLVLEGRGWAFQPEDLPLERISADAPSLRVRPTTPPTPKINSMKPYQNPRPGVVFANIDSQVEAEGIPADYPMVKWRGQDRHPTLRSGGWSPSRWVNRVAEQARCKWSVAYFPSSEVPHPPP